MNIVNTGTRYQIYGEELRTFNHLPPQTYAVGFSKQVGFFLTSHVDLDANEDIIYGNHYNRADKVLKSFALANRNFGVILSGNKGIGKSLFVRVLAEKAIEKEIPVIIVDAAIPGISDFLSSIEQEVMIVFDEFEKKFVSQENFDPQVELLSLFDGIDGGKKLFVITCNSINKLNEFFVNRPGRFHYHFEIGYPTSEEIIAYMNDKLGAGYEEVIDKVAKLGTISNLSYDCLRALCFELRQGYPLEETLRDLNITNDERCSFDVIIRFQNGDIMTAYSQYMNLCSDNRLVILFRPGNDRAYYLEFTPSNIETDNGVLLLPVTKAKFYGAFDNYDLLMSEEDAQKARDQDEKILKPQLITFSKVSNLYNNKYTAD